jgi:alpha-ketoglutarate-dependent taurine dioxygenase
MDPHALEDVDLAHADEQDGFPLVVCARRTLGDVKGWCRAHQDAIAELLVAHPALLFRGFSIHDPATFHRFIEALRGPLVPDRERGANRTELKDNVYTSSEYDPKLNLAPHNEMAMRHHWPMQISFSCIRRAEEGGENTLVDCRSVFKRVSDDIRRRFLESGLTYVRNFKPMIDVPWQRLFGTSDRSEIEQYCREASIEIGWGDRDPKWTRQWRPAAARHPTTKEEIWFNQAHQHHPAGLDAKVRDRILGRFGLEGAPKVCYYGRCESAVESEVVEHLRETYESCAVRVLLEDGDVLMVENMLVAHGRLTYRGSRELQTAMTELCSWGEVESFPAWPASV